MQRRYMRGFFAALRMTSKSDSNDKSRSYWMTNKTAKANGKTKQKADPLRG